MSARRDAPFLVEPARRWAEGTWLRGERPWWAHREYTSIGKDFGRWQGFYRKVDHVIECLAIAMQEDMALEVDAAHDANWKSYARSLAALDLMVYLRKEGFPQDFCDMAFHYACQDVLREVEVWNEPASDTGWCWDGEAYSAVQRAGLERLREVMR